MKWNYKYINDYITHNSDLNGEYYIYLYDGFCELWDGCDEKHHIFVQWSSLTQKEKQSYCGYGNFGEPRFLQAEEPHTLYSMTKYCHIVDIKTRKYVYWYLITSSLIINLKKTLSR